MEPAVWCRIQLLDLPHDAGFSWFSYRTCHMVQGLAMGLAVWCRVQLVQLLDCHMVQNSAIGITVWCRGQLWDLLYGAGFNYWTCHMVQGSVGSAIGPDIWCRVQLLDLTYGAGFSWFSYWIYEIFSG